MSVSKPSTRLQKQFRWPGLTKDLFGFIALCPHGVVNKVGRDRLSPQSMPLPVALVMMVAADLAGLFPINNNGNKYLFSIIDHCTSWVDKSSKGIDDFISNEYIPKHSIPNICNGLEFKSK